MIERDYELLHRFLDGEMTSAEQQDFERSLAQNTELAAMRRELEEMGRMLRTHVEHELEETDFSNFFAGIEQQLPAMATVGGASQVARNPVAPVDAKPEGGLVAWLSRFWAPALIGAAAAAAIALFAVNRPSTPASGQAAPQVVVVDSVKIEGTQTVLVMEPVDKDDATVIWLIDGEKESQEPVDGEDPI